MSEGGTTVIDRVSAEDKQKAPAVCFVVLFAEDMSDIYKMLHLLLTGLETCVTP